MVVSTIRFNFFGFYLWYVQYSYLDPEEIIGSDNFKAVESFLHGTSRKNIGWHYIIDLTWIYSQAIRWRVWLRVLDAGGGRYRQLLKSAKKAVFESALLHNRTYLTYENRHEN